MPWKNKRRGVEAMSRYNRYGDFFPPSRPKEAKGGIKAQNKKGTFGENWWAKRWIATLESFSIGARLGRGRAYARSGQVLSISIAKGLVEAKVQGSRSTPYSVVIKVKPLSETDWAKLVKALSSQVIFAAKLLAGEMPQGIEEAFKEAKLSLFPEKSKDLQTDCSCPDWSNPCKHIAAVYYLLGEEFDRNPFLIFKMRGLERDELLKSLGKGMEKAGTVKGRDESATGAQESVPLPSEPLGMDSAAFWKGSELPGDPFGEVRLPPMQAALLKRVGNFPFWRGEISLRESLEPLYGRASQLGLDTFLGKTEGEEADPVVEGVKDERETHVRPGAKSVKKKNPTNLHR
jgi:uncharacterized Zn finger protein